MLVSSLAGFLLSGLASAAALPADVPKSLAETKPTILTENDIIVHGDNGRVEIWSKDKYKSLASLYGSPLNAATALTPSSNSPPSDNSPPGRSNSKISRRCDSESVIIENEDQSFLNWDVPMTSVIHATGATSTISISTGFSIADSIAVSAAAALTLVKDFLTTTYTITYTKTWTTTTTSAYIFAVNSSQYAAIVSNPQTLRKSGTVWEGCIGDATATTYQADSYTSQSWGDLAWVSGIISLCTGDTYPLPMCLGDGFIN